MKKEAVIVQRRGVKRKILALDYDGVIADSNYECLAVGFNTYLKFRNDATLFNGKKFTYGNFKKLIHDHKNTVDRYEKLRPFAIDAFCWYVILSILEENAKIKSQSEYNKIRNNLMPIYNEFVKEFYKERYRLQTENFEKWLTFVKPFKIVRSINQLKSRFVITIATNNMEKTILGFLRKYDIPVQTIADKKLGINKLKQLEYIKNKHKVGFSDLYFVDDQVLHFQNLMKLKVNCFLATWGYNNDEQKKYAQKIGAELLTEKDFYGKLIAKLDRKI